MQLNELAERAGIWCDSYRPRRHRTPEFIFAHLHEEVSEAWKCWRRDELVVTFDRLGPPHGLPAELADVMIDVAIIARKFGIDLDGAVDQKFVLDLDRRLAAKRGR